MSYNSLGEVKKLKLVNFKAEKTEKAERDEEERKGCSFFLVKVCKYFMRNLKWGFKKIKLLNFQIAK